MFVEPESWDDNEHDEQTDRAPPAASSASFAPADTARLESLLERAAIAHPPGLPRPRPPRLQQQHSSKPPAAARKSPAIELGFAVPAPGYDFPPCDFPSKVGGAPVWLLPTAPEPQLRACARCGRPLRLLLQIYSPRPEFAQSYHRSVLLFCCGGACLRSTAGWRVLRTNLPKETPHYALAADGSYVASGWPAASTAPERPALPEFHLSVWPEGDWQEWLRATPDTDADRVGDSLRRYEARNAGIDDSSAEGVSDGGRGTVDVDITGLEEVGDGGGELSVFQRRVSVWPEQVLRYHHTADAAPLRLAPGVPDGVPPCSRCGAARWFEFQVMPHLISVLDKAVNDEVRPIASVEELDGGAESLDWGIVCVYTCSRSCGMDEESPYAEEVCWIQQVG